MSNAMITNVKNLDTNYKEIYFWHIKNAPTYLRLTSASFRAANFKKSRL